MRFVSLAEIFENSPEEEKPLRSFEKDNEYNNHGRIFRKDHWVDMEKPHDQDK